MKEERSKRSKEEDIETDRKPAAESTTSNAQQKEAVAVATHSSSAESKILAYSSYEQGPPPRPRSSVAASANQQTEEVAIVEPEAIDSSKPTSTKNIGSLLEQKQRHGGNNTEHPLELIASPSSYADEGSLSSVPKEGLSLTRGQYIDPTRAVGAVRMVGARRMTGEEERVQEEDVSDRGRQRRSTRASLRSEAPLLSAHLVVENQGGQPTGSEQAIMDEPPSTYRPRRLPSLVVEASPLKQPSCRIHGKLTWIMILVLVCIVVAVTLGIFFGLQARGSSMNEEDIDDRRDVGNTREAFVRDVLPEWTRDKLLDPLSDPSRALDWLWCNATLTTDLPLFRKVQRFAMATAFLAATAALDGYTFDLESGCWQPDDGFWLSSQHECEWPQQALPSVACRDGRLVVLDFFQATSIFGTIAAEVALLSDLTLLDLSSTRMFGTLPTTLGLMANLEQLRVIDTNVTGKMPTELGHMTTMKRLRLRSNLLKGTIPTELALIPELKVLSLYDNMLSGTLPAELLMRGTTITNLLLGVNSGISGPIPTEIGLMTQLLELSVPDCNITGSMPSELGRLTAIDVLHVYQNSELTGTIPIELRSLIHMTEFLAHETALTGRFPLCDSNLDIAAIDCARMACDCGCVCLTKDSHADFIV